MGNIVLTDAVGKEVKVDRATFIRGDRLARVRKQLGLGATVAEIKKKSSSTRGFFEENGAFAVVRHTGTREEVEERGLKIVREEASILAASQLGYSTRKQMGPVALSGERAASYAHFLAVSSRDAGWFGRQSMRTSGAELVVFDGNWERYCNQVFFTRLLQILRKEVKVEEGWREELRRAAIMVGESVSATDRLKSFTWNWVVLEMLLTRREDKVGEALPRRAEALLGWTGFWQEYKYEERIRKVYQKRNALLHSGKREGISAEDLEFTDELLLNLFANLVSNPEHFRSKAAVIDLSKKVEAERTLGLDPSVRPLGLKYIRRLSTRYRMGLRPPAQPSDDSDL